MGRITNKSGVSVKPIAHIVDKLYSEIVGASNFATMVELQLVHKPL